METALAMIGAALAGGAVGAVITANRFREAIVDARADVQTWSKKFRQAAGELGSKCADYDEEKTRGDVLMSCLDDTRATLFRAEPRIADLQPLYDLGLRRRAAKDAYNQKKRDERAAVANDGEQEAA